MPALYERCRPQKAEDFAGQPGRIAKALKRELGKRDQLACLISGVSGTGKSSMAAMIVRELGVGEMDTLRYNSANLNGIDFIRRFEYDIRLGSWNGSGWRVFIFEEAHNLTPAAQQALLNVLEHYPKKRVLIFTAMRTAGMNDAFKSRLLRIPLQPLEVAEMTDYLQKIARKEGRPMKRALAREIAQRSAGNLRKALEDLESSMLFGELPEEEESTPEEFLTAGQKAARKAVATRRARQLQSA